MKKERGLALAACAALAALMLLFASQCSPLYPINLWDDANCLLTVGRVMRAGGVVYRDIYEQKGPTLYLLHALAACVSDSGFLGVYLMETLSLAASLFAAYRLFRLRAGRAWSLGGTAAWGAIVLISPSFCKGDSAEEFCLPLLMAAMAVAYAEYGRRARPMRFAWLAFCGLMAGILQSSIPCWARCWGFVCARACLRFGKAVCCGRLRAQVSFWRAWLCRFCSG